MAAFAFYARTRFLDGKINFKKTLAFKKTFCYILFVRIEDRKNGFEKVFEKFKVKLRRERKFFREKTISPS